jgi:heme/copper-type cytochrome/quinol oxidase subunit 2
MKWAFNYKKYGLLSIGLIILLCISSGFYNLYEGFGSTSPGTMVQLQTSHVPTEEDDYYWRFIYPKVVRREIYNMTESDL